jgi:hypothetical protein
VGYFSNGTEGAMYEEDYCNRCVHRGNDEDGGCVVWLAHLMYSYTECNSKSNAKHILDLLIPPSKDHLYNEQCRMFHYDPKVDQMDMFEDCP